MDEIRWVTSTRMRVVNTHHHYDHAFGNYAFVPCEIWGHERCATRLREDSRTAQFALAAAMPEVAPEYVETRITPPDKTFRESVELELGGRPVTLDPFRPRAHRQRRGRGRAGRARGLRGRSDRAGRPALVRGLLPAGLARDRRPDARGGARAGRARPRGGGGAILRRGAAGRPLGPGPAGSPGPLRRRLGHGCAAAVAVPGHWPRDRRSCGPSPSSPATFRQLPATDRQLRRPIGGSGDRSAAPATDRRSGDPSAAPGGPTPKAGQPRPAGPRRARRPDPRGPRSARRQASCPAS